MDFLFADDSRQNKPSRNGMGPLVAVGGVHIDDQNVKPLEMALEQACIQAGFPEGEEFKWSPDRNSWMRQHLHGQQRTEFFIDLISKAKDYDAKVYIIIEDNNLKPANKSLTSDMDVVVMLLERFSKSLGSTRSGIVIADRPGGGQGDRQKFLQECYTKLKSGTRYVRFENIALSVIATPSKHIRLLQFADLITGGSLAYVSGESNYSPQVFNKIINLLPKDYSRVGGYSFKIHPDYIYANLYHWLLGDTQFIKNQNSFPYPLKNRPYREGPDKR